MSQQRLLIALAWLTASAVLTTGCTTWPSLKRELAQQPPRRNERKEEVLVAFEAQRDAAQLQAALDRFNEGNHAACHQQLAALVERRPQFVEARLQLAEFHLCHGELDQAQEQLRAALVLAPQRADLHDCLGRVLEAGSRDREAAEHFQTAAKLEPGNELYRSPFDAEVARISLTQAAPR
jgi:Tfp pilus assembly protein PilF